MAVHFLLEMKEMVLQMRLDHKIKIPMKGKVESLNAAVSATILMYETMRQREFM